MSKRIALLGAGNMGRSLLGGLIAQGFKPETLFVAEPSDEKLSEIKNTFKVNTCPSNLVAIQNADLIILAVKPQVMPQVIKEIADPVKKTQPVLLSIAAGLPIANFEKWLGGKVPIVRSMPNTPALVGSGASALYANELVTPEQRLLAESILKAVGITVWVDHEKQMDTVTSVSGNGPAYFFLVIEALVDAAEKLGLDKKTALKLAAQTALGAAKMVIETQEDPAVLRQKVTSPGGTTEQALKVLESQQIRDIFFEALQASNRRAETLATQLS